VDRDPTNDLDLAKRAWRASRELDSALDDAIVEFDRQETALSRAIHLYSAMKDMIGVQEESILLNTSADDAIEKLIDVADRSLRLAADFKMAEHWTLSICKTEPSSNGRRQLRCIATRRSMKCDLSDARVWPEGIGAAGIALSKAEEVVVPDLADPALGTLHKIPGDLTRNHDDGRYRSIIADPILIGPETEPWGVVIATSDRPNHFSAKGDPGIQAAEAIRCLTRQIELAIASRTYKAANDQSDVSATDNSTSGPRPIDANDETLSRKT
jgi:hypothetical protein